MNIPKIEIHEITNINDIDFLKNKNSFKYAFDQALIKLLKKNFKLIDSLYLVVKKDGAAIGFCSVDRDWWEENYFFIREIMVEKEFRQEGCGLELMQRCINHARNKRAIGVVTETAHDNIPMQNLCTKLGFNEWDNPDWKEGLTYKLAF